MSVSSPCISSSPSCSVLTQLSQLLKSQGHSACAMIDQHLFFHVSHSPVLQCAVMDIENSAPLAIRAVSHSQDLEQLNLSESVQRFLDHPAGLKRPNAELVCIFLSDWMQQVSSNSASPDLVISIANLLVEVEHWLSDDGPGSCVLAGPWVIWTVGRYGMSDLMIARNRGDLPAPDLATAIRWDGIGQFNMGELISLSVELGAWRLDPSVWSFRGRSVPVVSS